MSASMEMLRARLIELLTPHLSGRYVKWREAYFTRFTKCGGDSGWMEPAMSEFEGKSGKWAWEIQK
ncbi:hypothetical protein VP396_20000, partial (plasmid) [Acinetobacter baumannii]